MNDIATVDSGEATLVPTDVRHYVIDPTTGERVEVDAPEAPEVFVQGEEGPVATEYADA